MDNFSETYGLTYETGLKVAEDTARQHATALVGMLRTRKAHPTYGISKAALRERLAWMEAALHVVDCMRGGAGASVGVSALNEAERLGIDYRGLRGDVWAS